MEEQYQSVVLRTDDDWKWRAVLERDGEADGQLFFGVKTTGIYCRPSCPARRPRRKNVVFLNSAPEAEAAGFRACKRCRPAANSPAETRNAVVERACRAIEQRFEDGETSLSLDALAAEVGMSRHHFHRLFKAVTGLTPKRFAVGIRITYRFFRKKIFEERAPRLGLE